MITPSKPRLRSATVEAFLRGNSSSYLPATEQKAARAKRQAFDIRFRCTLTGCDWTARLFLREASEAFDVMYSRLAYGEGTGQGKLRYGREFYRVVSCDLSPDQSRPVG